MARTSVLLTMLILFAGLLVACNREPESPELPETPVLLGQESFALVAERYVRLFSRPAGDAAVQGHARRNDVLAVIGRTADGAWIELDERDRHGWVRRDFLRLYATREQARNGRALLDRGGR